MEGDKHTDDLLDLWFGFTVQRYSDCEVQRVHHAQVKQRLDQPSNLVRVSRVDAAWVLEENHLDRQQVWIDAEGSFDQLDRILAELTNVETCVAKF